MAIEQKIIKLAQIQLRRKGCNVGKPDGVIGKKTLDALHTINGIDTAWDTEKKIIAYIQLLALENLALPCTVDGNWNTGTNDAYQQLITLFENAGMLTKPMLKKIMIYPNDDAIDAFYPYLNDTFKKYTINTPIRIAHFIAQLLHESGEFKYAEEIASGDAYEGRRDLGNTQMGDGRKFKGRGLIQITGRANYSAYGNFIAADIITGSNPQIISHDPFYSVDSAGWFWNVHKNLNPIADTDNVIQVTKKINGGTNGLDERKNYLTRAKNVLGI